MRLVVVDPRVLIQGFECPRSPPAQLLALFAYGRVSINAAGFRLEELSQMEEHKETRGRTDMEQQRAWAEQDVQEAQERKALMDDAIGQHVPEDLLLATSPPLLQELTGLAQIAQGRGKAHVYPDRVRRHADRHTFRALTDLGPAPNYLTRGKVSKHDYLIHTAMEAEASDLITNDDDLLLPGDAYHRSQTTGHRVHPYSFDEFVAALPSILKLEELDPQAILAAAVAPLARASYESA